MRPTLLTALTLSLLLAGAPATSQPGRVLILATTTSTVDTGLLDVLNPAFERQFGAQVRVVALGTGAALKSAEAGDADLVLVHARPAEDAFLRAGFGVNRRDVMFNDFVIVGPPDDPAGIKDAAGAPQALARIAAAGSPFLSRGDNSGTHQKERALWAAAGIEPGGAWYLSTGQGMGETLVQADERGAYALSDRGTFLALRARLGLAVLVEGPVKGGDPLLLNPYGAIVTNPARHPRRAYALAMAYLGYLTSPEAQALIAAFTVDGEPLFFPDALSEGPNFKQHVPSDAPDF